MKLSQYRKNYYEFSGKASNVCRQVAFAGIALVWIFKKEGVFPSIPQELFWPSMFLVIALACDLLHYVVASLIWGCFQRTIEKRLNDLKKNPKLTAPRHYNWPMNIFYWSKIVCVITAYIMIIKFLIFKLVNV